MNVIYLDQNFAITLAERSESDERYRRARDAVTDSVRAGKAVYPYSELHLIESAAMNAESRRRIGQFWDAVSRGFRFIQQKRIRSSQFKATLLAEPIRFRPHLVLYPETRSNFDYWIYTHEPESARARREQLHLVVEHWATLNRQDIDRRIRQAEANALPKLVLQLFNRMLRHELPSLGELDSEYVEISSELSWTLRDRGRGDDTLFEAIRFMQEHALDVPAIAIECTGLEALAERYAADNVRRSSIHKSKLDHDSNDLAALSNFVPYCIAGTTDAKALGIMQRAYKKMGTTPPRLFALRDVEKFTAFVTELPAPVTEIHPEAEATSAEGRCLIIIRRKGNELITREPFPPSGCIQRELLPRGGLKVWSSAQILWADLLRELQRFGEHLKAEANGHAILYGLTSSDGAAVLRFKIDVPFGMFNVAEEEIRSALKHAEV